MKQFKDAIAAGRAQFDSRKDELKTATTTAYELFDTFLKCKAGDFDAFDPEFVVGVSSAINFFPPISGAYLVNVVGARLAAELKPAYDYYDKDNNSDAKTVINWKVVNGILDLHPNILEILHGMANSKSAYQAQAAALLSAITCGEITAETEANDTIFSAEALILYNLNADVDDLLAIAPPSTSKDDLFLEFLTNKNTIHALQGYFNANNEFDFYDIWDLYIDNPNTARVVVHPNAQEAVRAGLDPINIADTNEYLIHDNAVELYRSGVSFATVKLAISEGFVAKKDPVDILTKFPRSYGRDEEAKLDSNAKTKQITGKLAIYSQYPEIFASFTALRKIFASTVHKANDDTNDNYKAACYLMDFDSRTLRGFFKHQILPAFNSIAVNTHIAPAMEKLKELKSLYEADLLNTWFLHCKKNDMLRDFKGILQSLSGKKITDKTFEAAFGFGIEKFDSIPLEVRKRVFGFAAMCMYRSGAELRDLSGFFVKGKKISNDGASDFEKLVNTNSLQICILSQRFRAMHHLFVYMRNFFDLIISANGTKLILTEIDGKGNNGEINLPFAIFGFHVVDSNAVSFIEGTKITDQRTLDAFCTPKIIEFLQLSKIEVGLLYACSVDDSAAFTFLTSDTVKVFLKNEHTMQEVNDIIIDEEKNYTTAKQTIIAKNKIDLKAKNSPEQGAVDAAPSDAEVEVVEEAVAEKGMQDDVADVKISTNDNTVVDAEGSPTATSNSKSANWRARRGGGSHGSGGRNRGGAAYEK